MGTMVARGSSQVPSSSVSHQEKGHRNKRKFRSDPPTASDPNKIAQPQVDNPTTTTTSTATTTSATTSATTLSTATANASPTAATATAAATTAATTTAAPTTTATTTAAPTTAATTTAASTPANTAINGSCGYGFPMEFNAEQHSADAACDICSSTLCPVDEELDLGDFQDADWNAPTEAELRELLLGNLDAMFSGVIRKIASQGYTEEEAKKALLRLNPCYGSKDTISSIADDVLAFLGRGEEADGDPSMEHCFEDMRLFEEHVLSEMISVLREMRPFFSSGDAMWFLLICDMNVSHACAMDGGDDMTFSSSLPQMKHELNLNNTPPHGPLQLNCEMSHKSNTFPLHSQAGVQNDLPTLPPMKIPSFDSLDNPLINAGTVNPNPTKQNLPSLVDCVIEGFSSTGISDAQAPSEKPMNGKRSSGVGISRRDSILRQKSLHLEKGCRAHRSKGSLRSGKLSNLGNLVDRKTRPSSDAAGLNLKNSMLKKSKPLGLDTLQGGETPALSFSAGSSARLPSTLRTNNSISQLPSANTELSLSLPPRNTISRSNNAPSILTNGIGDIPKYCSYNGFQSEKSCRQWVFQDRKDEVMHKLVPRVREVEAHLQEWLEWAQQKVMQAARRLSKDKSELQTLRQEKEEASRLKKEKQSLEENTMKKLSEMEVALSKAGCQVDKANATICRLEVENDHLMHQMEKAKFRAAKSAQNCLEISRREMTTVKTFQSWDRQKAQSHEELTIDKHKLSQLQQQYSRDKECLDQLEGRLKQEEKARDDALTLAQCERKECEQMEISAKSKEDALRLKAENDLLLHKDDMRRLENQIAQLRLETDASKMAALRQGIMDLQESGCDEVQRERECVMCLTEEMSVVFLPCAHQVVCGTCNKLHEQQGMNDCPSCRTPIKQRIMVRYARS